MMFAVIAVLAAFSLLLLHGVCGALVDGEHLRNIVDDARAAAHRQDVLEAWQVENELVEQRPLMDACVRFWWKMHRACTDDLETTLLEASAKGHTEWRTSLGAFPTRCFVDAVIAGSVHATPETNAVLYAATRYAPHMLLTEVQHSDDGDSRIMHTIRPSDDFPACLGLPYPLTFLGPPPVPPVPPLFSASEQPSCYSTEILSQLLPWYELYALRYHQALAGVRDATNICFAAVVNGKKQLPQRWTTYYDIWLGVKSNAYTPTLLSTIASVAQEEVFDVTINASIGDAMDAGYYPLYRKVPLIVQYKW